MMVRADLDRYAARAKAVDAVRVLVTGASGFVGRYLVEALRRENADVVACGGPHDGEDVFPARSARPGFVACERSTARVPTSYFIWRRRVSFRPRSSRRRRRTTSISWVPRVWPKRCAPRPAAIRPRFIFASSAEVYGPREATSIRCVKRWTASGQSIRREQGCCRVDAAGRSAEFRLGRRHRARLQSNRSRAKRTIRRALDWRRSWLASPAARRSRCTWATSQPRETF